jgi:hypothetical protein
MYAHFPVGFSVTSRRREVSIRSFDVASEQGTTPKRSSVRTGVQDGGYPSGRWGTRLFRNTGMATSLMTCFVDQSFGCAYDGILPNGLSAVHPRSISVAIAAHDFLASNGSGLAAKPERAREGYWRAVRRLARLQEVFQPMRGSRPGISIVLVDSDLWSGLSPIEDGYAVSMHTPGARPGDVVVLTTESAIAAIEDRVVTVSQAVLRGMIEVDGGEADARRVTDQLLKTTSIGGHSSKRRTWLFRN